MRLDLGPALPALKFSALLRIDAAAERAARMTGAEASADDRAAETEARALLAADAIAPVDAERAYPFIPGGGAGWLLTAAPDPAAYPLVVAEAAARAAVLGEAGSLEAVARAIVAEAEAARVAAATIRELRRAAVLRITAATSPAAVAAAEAVAWPT